MLLCFCVLSWAGVAHRGNASPDDAVHVLNLACPASSVLAGWRVVCLRSGCGFPRSVVRAWRCRSAYGRLVCRWACPAAAGVSALVLVPVVRMCVAPERSGCCGGAVGRWLCGGRPAVARLSMGLPHRSWWVSIQPRWLAPDVEIAVLSHVAVL